MTCTIRRKSIRTITYPGSDYDIGMAGLPVMLQIKDRPCLVVGGGDVALRRAKALLAADAQVTVIAPEVDSQIAELAVSCVYRAYKSSDLADVFLVVIATDDRHLNQQIAGDARDSGVLVNLTDDPETSDFQVPAHERNGPITLAVHTDGISASAAASIRKELIDKLDPAWRTLLETAAPFRQKVQQQIADAKSRQPILRRLADQTAMEILKGHGIRALKEHYEQLLACAMK